MEALLRNLGVQPPSTPRRRPSGDAEAPRRRQSSGDVAPRYHTFPATKFTYDAKADTWHPEQLKLRIAHKPFSTGSMRAAYRAWELVEDGSPQFELVAKKLRPELHLPLETICHDAMTQMVAESFAQEFNRACAERSLAHCVAFLPVSAARLEGMAEPVCLEPYMSGDYVKHNDNAGHNNTNDEVAAAFSYFSYVASRGRMLVCDIQGVGTFYTDPQIHTLDGVGFGLGNLGRQGIHRFLRSHHHSQLCEDLGLPRPDGRLSGDLSGEQIARGLQATFEYGGAQRDGPAWNGERYMNGFTALAHSFGGHFGGADRSPQHRRGVAQRAHSRQLARQSQDPWDLQGFIDDINWKVDSIVCSWGLSDSGIRRWAASVS
mmetsp:Transcript_14504/g.41383  ORF Transcript_14504/g.41383 Transcript_14504/m.41383 type:complete len:375 (-) Transcript_14504:59-1183(-)|eukprot:CAMPEP_0179267254 /NCGR_PEP_ID=MMETSP0797-20121207/29831_1 /TAXON_ID=47934 /ORGANISM="Dinophysis acuminata, Strain DAEP01" /LENGTH=374 /DNA_ID=CAMNT_0020975501 /DNA_START=25 /DNA_END=1149 /DNA_ORIENTATION=-